MLRWVSGILIALAAAPALSAEEPISFREHVAPILVRSCLGCHDSRKALSGLNMSTFALLKAGGKNGETDILEPGDPDASGLVESVRPDASAPNKRRSLSDQEIRTLETWVKQGAKFDGGSETETPIASLVDPLKGLPVVTLKSAAVEPVTALAYSPDGPTLAVAAGASALLFDGETGKALAPGISVNGHINALQFTPDGKTLIAAGGRAGMFGLVSRFELATGSPGESRGCRRDPRRRIFTRWQDACHGRLRSDDPDLNPIR